MIKSISLYGSEACVDGQKHQNTVGILASVPAHKGSKKGVIQICLNQIIERFI